MRLSLLIAILSFGVICIGSAGRASQGTENPNDLIGFVSDSLRGAPRHGPSSLLSRGCVQAPVACDQELSTASERAFKAVDNGVEKRGDQERPVRPLRECIRRRGKFIYVGYSGPFEDYTCDSLSDMSVPASSVAKEPTCCLNKCRGCCCRPSCEYVCSMSSIWEMVKVFCFMTCCSDKPSDDPLKDHLSAKKYRAYRHDMQKEIEKSCRLVREWDEGERSSDEDGAF